MLSLLLGTAFMTVQLTTGQAVQLSNGDTRIQLNYYSDPDCMNYAGYETTSNFTCFTLSSVAVSAMLVCEPQNNCTSVQVVQNCSNVMPGSKADHILYCRCSLPNNATLNYTNSDGICYPLSTLWGNSSRFTASQAYIGVYTSISPETLLTSY